MLIIYPGAENICLAIPTYTSILSLMDGEERLVSVAMVLLFTVIILCSIISYNQDSTIAQGGEKAL